jgi:hypothetical protein
MAKKKIEKKTKQKRTPFRQLCSKTNMTTVQVAHTRFQWRLHYKSTITYQRVFAKTQMCDSQVIAKKKKSTCILLECIHFFMNL